MKYGVALNGNLENICEKYRLKPLDYEMAGGQSAGSHYAQAR